VKLCLICKVPPGYCNAMLNSQIERILLSHSPGIIPGVFPLLLPSIFQSYPFLFLLPFPSATYTIIQIIPIKHQLRVPYLNHVLLFLLPGARTLDQCAQVANGNLEWEVQGSEHDSEEDPPTGHRGHKEASTASNL